MKARQRFSDWFSQQDTTAEEEESTKKHRFFTNCLKEIRDTLRPVFETPRPTKVTLSQSTVPMNLENNFQLLNFEDDEGDDLLGFEEETLQRTRPGSSQAKNKTIYELDEPIEEDIPFLV